MRRILVMVLLIAVAALPLFAAGGGETTEDRRPTFVLRNISPGQDYVMSERGVIGEWLANETGIDIQFVHSVGDENEAVALMIASGDLPDAVSVRGEDASPFVEAGYALELTDLVTERAPRLLRRLEEANKWDTLVWSAEDPGRYFLPRLTDPANHEVFDVDNWFFLQHDVVISQGYPEIRTLEDYERAIKRYLEENPTIDGQPTIGLTMVTDQWRWIISLTNPGMMAAGLQTQGEFWVDPDTREVWYRIMRPEEQAYYRWLNRMWNEGIIDRDAFTQTLDQYRSKVSTGRVLAVTDMGWQLGPAEAALREQGMFNRTYGAYPVAINEDTTVSTNSGGRALQVPGPTVIITTENRDAEAFIDFLDFYASEEVQIARNWGFEGEHYDVENGRRVMRPEFRELILSDSTRAGELYGFGIFGASLPYMEPGALDKTGMNYYTIDSPLDVRENYNEADLRVLDGYGVQTFGGFFPQPEDYPVRPWPAEASITGKFDEETRVLFNRVQDVVKRDVIQAIIAPQDQFEARWAQFLDNMRDAGVERLTDRVSQLMDEQMELWGRDTLGD